MTIKAKLTKDQLFRLALLRHMERPTFFFNAFTSAALIAYATWKDIYIILFVAWMPFTLYIALGVFEAWRNSRDRNNPLLLSTSYEFTDAGVSITTSLAKSSLEWKQFDKVKVMIDCYVFTLNGGQIIAIPRTDVAANHKQDFENLIREKISRK